jgi:hypothetical protein
MAMRIRAAPLGPGGSYSVSVATTSRPP